MNDQSAISATIFGINMDIIATTKIVVATFFVLGVILGLLNLIYAPHILLRASWFVPAASGLLYIIADHF